MLRKITEGADAAPRLFLSIFPQELAWRGTRRRACAALAAAVATASLGGCAGSGSGSLSGAEAPMFPESKWGVSASRRVASHQERIPKGGGTYKVGVPYKVGGRWYNPREQPDYDRVGIASWYGSDFHGRKTANGEIFDMHALTAAHPTLPMPSYAYVTSLSTNRTILVRINDRGPYVGERMIDLSRASARELGLMSGGTGRVRVRYAGPAPLDGNDARERQYLASRQGSGGMHIAARERAESAREWAAHRNTARAQSQMPPVRPRMTVADRSHIEGYGQAYGQPQQQAYRQSYADTGRQPGSGELWSPEQYRAAIAAR
ncbi:septal ring lytic transglycosylase RlpA family protein [Hyphomicrobium sp. CS1GBMeth3]|uniref:septal ring lytic transglycosylase RlpA family protein n=1 Tax=Hyphomicrobium sp. CS1GBMeth3 TaxID=1892845 RepID=UPI001FCDDA2D|nr:septal ring lytic transglycosylase RlpA family protein [Hyphomicrobium sp. CS1GBMeth3]